MESMLLHNSQQGNTVATLYLGIFLYTIELGNPPRVSLNLQVWITSSPQKKKKNLE